MKQSWMSWLVGGALAVSSVSAEQKPNQSVETRLRKYCDPVCQLKSQDTAFSILLETYREFQSYQIENNYQHRLTAAANLSPEKADERHSLIIEDNSPTMIRLRELVLRLAAKERELSYGQLQVRVENLKTAYNCVRRHDEYLTGTTVPNTASTSQAAEELKHYVIVSPGAPAGAKGRQEVKPQPASTVLLNTTPVALPPGQTVEACTPDDEVIEYPFPADRLATPLARPATTSH